MSQQPTSLGLSENLASALSYIFGWISGIIIFILERNNKTVRFHALQSTIFSLCVSVVTFFVNVLPIIRHFSWILNLAVFVSMVYLAYNAYVGKKFKLPVIGDIVENQVNK